MGADVPFHDVLTLNVRTEIAYGFFDDGCTALSWHSSTGSKRPIGASQALLAQNWDWRAHQLANLIHMTISQPGRPTIAMITEAGIIGKIGLNSQGLGVCLNAISAKQVSYNKLPVHLALRAALDTVHNEVGHQNTGRSYLEMAVDKVRVHGVASSAHILIATTEGAIGLECTFQDVALVPERNIKSGRMVTHTNHFIQDHGTVKEFTIMKDSVPRLNRVNKLLEEQQGPPSLGSVQEILKDEEGYPISICRNRTEDSEVITVFSIVMDLNSRMAKVKLGRPTEGGEEVIVSPRKNETIP